MDHPAARLAAAPSASFSGRAHAPAGQPEAETCRRREEIGQGVKQEAEGENPGPERDLELFLTSPGSGSEHL